MKNRRNIKLNKKIVQSHNTKNTRGTGSSKHFSDVQSCPMLNNKRGFRASGLSLLPLALRPGLLMAYEKSNIKCNTENATKINTKCNLFKNTILRNLVLLAVVFIVSFVLQNSYSNSVLAASLALTIPNSISLDINPSSNNGFSKSDKSTLSIKTDVEYGYTLSIKTKDAVNSNNLINGSSKLTSISSAMNENDFSSSAGNNTWGFLPSKFNSNDNTNFQPGPTSEPTVLDTTSSSTEGTNYDFTLAAKVDNTIPTGSYTNTFVLTAVSNEPPYDGIMQDWDGCESLPEETKTLNLLDTRDNKIYTVAKLKDGKCWMTKNLEIGKEGEETKLTSEDSDVTSDFTLPASSTSGFSNYDVANVYVHSTYGGYYTWYAATAGEGTQQKTSGDTSHSICPKGWKLPSKTEYDNLVTKQGSAKMTQSPANFMLSGVYYYGSANRQSSSGNYWSSTAYDDLNAYLLYVDSSDANTNFGSEYGGFSVRCISRSTGQKTINDLKYMQDWGDLSEVEQIKVSDSMESEKTYQLIDKRDNKTYTLAKLKDGRIWMTKNLEIAGKTLTSDDSDVESDFVLPASNPSGFGGFDTSNTRVYINSTYGGYYTWPAAAAGEGGTSSISSGDTAHSICPRGWKLPSNTEFNTLISSQGSANFTKSPASFLLGGSYYNNSFDRTGSVGYYWSSTSQDGLNASQLILSNSEAYTSDNQGKPLGNSVRCVAREPGITYDPGLEGCNDSMDPSYVNNMPSPNPQTWTTTLDSINLSSSTPTNKMTYTFVQWCSVKPTSFDACPSSGKTYSPGDPYPLTGSTNNITLYAIWRYVGGPYSCGGDIKIPE